MKKSLFSLSLLLLVACSSVAQKLEPQTLLGPTPVLSVVDGDTIKVTINGASESVRLIGIDTPETKHPTKGVEPYGPEASAFTHALLEGKEVFIEFDVQERDRYSRPLVYVYLSDPEGDWSFDGERFIQVNVEIALAGWADVLTIAPNVRYADLYREAVAEARANHRGMWADAATPLEVAAMFDPKGEDRDCKRLLNTGRRPGVL